MNGVISVFVLLFVSCGSLFSAQLATSSGSLSLRIADRTPSALFGTVDAGPVAVFAGMLQVRDSDYQEVVLGVGRSIGGGSTTVTIVAATSHASDGWYAQGYVIPSLGAGRVSISGIGVAYEPMEASAVRQFHWNPLSVTLRVGRRVNAGVSSVLSLVAGSAPVSLVGPTVRVDIGRGRSLGLTFLDDTRDRRNEVRLDAGARF